MIRYISSLIIFQFMVMALISWSSYAETSYGVKGGISVMKVRGDYLSGGDPLFAPCGGIYVSMSQEMGFVFQPEILLILKGMKEDYTPLYNATEKDKFFYIEIPVLIKYRVSANNSIGLSIFAGPSGGLLLNESYELTGPDANYLAYLLGIPTSGSFSDLGADTNFLELGLTFGAGIDFNVEGSVLNIDVRYSLGLTNIFNIEPAVNAKNGGFIMMMGYEF